MKYLQTFRIAASCLLLIFGANVNILATQNDFGINIVQGFTANPFIQNLGRRPLMKKPTRALPTVGNPTNPSGPSAREGSPSVNLKADYRFQGNLNSSVTGAPAMTELGFGNAFVSDNVDGFARQSLRFPQNSGLTIGMAGLIQNNNYTIVVLFKFDDVSDFRKIIDFANGTTDNGLYINNGIFEHENIPGSPPFSTGIYAQVVVVREPSGLVRQYRNGRLADSRNDGGDYLITAQNRLGFFQDDAATNGTEASAGNVARIRIYDGPLTNTEVLGLDRLPAATPTPTPTPQPSPTPTPSATPTPPPSPSPTPNPGCNYTIAPNGVDIPAAGGSGLSLNVMAPAGCDWTAVSGNSWITITSGASGNGNGTVTYSVSASAEPERTGSITIAGLTFVVFQQDGCSFSTNPGGLTFSRDGGNGVVNVTASNSACSWLASDDASAGPYITVPAGTRGRGNGSFAFSVAANITPFGRSAEIRLFSERTRQTASIFVVTQPDEAGCHYRISPSFNYARPLERLPFTVRVTAPEGCLWFATSPFEWVSVQTEAGFGTADMVYFVDGNSNRDQEFRTGFIRVAGLIHSITQGAPEDNCPLSRALIEAPSSGRYSLRDPSRAVEQLHGFRDQILGKTLRGKIYTRDYYQYAGEITKLMIFNPDLWLRSKDVLERYQPIVESVLDRERANRLESRLQPAPWPAKTPPEGGTQNSPEPTIVYEAELADVDELLSLFSAKASPRLRETLEALRRDIHDPRVQAEFGVRVERGEKRPLGEGRSTPGTIGGRSFFDFQTGLQFLNPFAAGTPLK